MIEEISQIKVKKPYVYLENFDSLTDKQEESFSLSSVEMIKIPKVQDLSKQSNHSQSVRDKDLPQIDEFSERS